MSLGIFLKIGTGSSIALSHPALIIPKINLI